MTDQTVFAAPLKDHDLLRSLIERSADGLMVIDQSGKIIYANPSALNMFIESMPQIVGADFGIPAVNEAVELVLPFRAEMRHVEMRASEISWQGKIVYLASLRDITERIKTEEALRESESHFRTLANSGQALIWTSGLDKNCNYFNQPWLDFTGRTLEQEMGTGWTEGVHPDDLQKCIDTYCQAFDRREKFSMIYRILRHDGQYRWIQDDGSPRYDSHGEFLGFIGHCLDISERIEYEQKLSESEELFRSLIEGAPDAVLVHSSHRHIFVNDAAVALFGAKNHKQLLAAPVTDLIPPARRSIAQKQIKKLLNEKLPVSTSETTRLRLDKSEVHVEISAVPIKFAGENSALSFIRNIEERLNARIEHENLLTQLAHAQKMESIGALAGGVAHDFNNMLQVILGETDFAIDANSAELPGSQLISCLTEIKKAAERSTELTRKLLAFARKQVHSPEVLNVNEVIERMLKMLRRTIGENIDLVWQPGDDVWRIEMDPLQLDQVLANLAVNARDAIKNVGSLVIGTGNIVLDKDMCARMGGIKPGDYVLLSVSDTGSGMEPEVLARVFEPFFTTKKVGKGTGLGLATVYGIIGQNDGSIKVYSESGIGTTFKIYLPRAEANEMPKKNVPYVDMSDLRGTETLLVVEDEIQILNFEKLMLERLGYKLLTANDPASALKIAEEYPGKIDLLITDVIMPGMNGKELQQKIMALRPQIESIFVSGYAIGIIEYQDILPGEINFIEKPFTASLFASKIRKVLDRSS